ncbi:hypothetical protein PT931_00495 [Longispora urticae]|uniref:hypothetical protein n=1 Tax=Longispora sp. NPDC051575 TaxID=3154943 RepID=UPI003432F2F1
MLGLGRKTLSRGEQISSELGECRDHLRGVASLIAEGAAEKLAPRVDQARDLVSPRVERAREAALHGLESATARLGGKRRSRWPLLVGVLGVGVVAGAAAALVMARRNARWDEYEPVHVLEFDDENPVAEKVRTVADNLRDTAGDVKDKAVDAAGDLKDKARDTLNHVADSVESGARKLKS